jgi:hypothetical protein
MPPSDKVINDAKRSNPTAATVINAAASGKSPGDDPTSGQAAGMTSPGQDLLNHSGKDSTPKLPPAAAAAAVPGIPLPRKSSHMLRVEVMDMDLLPPDNDLG